jgi:hypothetical protein
MISKTRETRKGDKLIAIRPVVMQSLMKFDDTGADA